MEFKPLDKTIRKIFDGHSTYMIPNFQREFSWNKKNYRDFLNDLLTSMSIEYKNEQFVYDNQADYFFGTILLVGNETSPQVDKPFIVVDGQQRLTTMTIFIAALKSIIENVDSNYLTEFEDTLLVKYTSDGKEKEKARLRNRALAPILPVNILNVNQKRDQGIEHEAGTEAQEWLLESYNEFKKLLERSQLLKLIFGNGELYSKLDDSKYIALLESIGKHLLKSTIVAIYTPEEKSANIIYRNFNSRGVPLTNIDLIKNELFSVLDDDSTSTTTLWNEIKVNIYNSRADMKKYLYHYMVFKKLVSTEAKIYDSFMEKITPDSKSYSEFLKDLHKKSSYYYNFISVPDNLELFGVKDFFRKNNNFLVKKRLQFFNDVEIEQVRVILLRLFESIEDGKLTTTQFKRILTLIVRHQVLHLVARTSPNRLTTLYRSYLTKFNNRETIEAEISEFEKDFIKRLPPKEQVLNNILLINYSRSSSSKKAKKETTLLKQILIELSIWNQCGTNISNNGLEFIFDSSIEHIKDHALDEKNINNLGNLLLLEQSKHFNNVPKSDMYANSDITLTQNFSSEVDKFTSTGDIDKRSRELISIFYDNVKNRREK